MLQAIWVAGVYHLPSDSHGRNGGRSDPGLRAAACSAQLASTVSPLKPGSGLLRAIPWESAE